MKTKKKYSTDNKQNTDITVYDKPITGNPPIVFEKHKRKKKPYEHVPYVKRNFPDYAFRYKNKTGKKLRKIMHLDNDTIREKFAKVGLNRPSRSFLDYYRTMLQDPAIMANRIDRELSNFLSEKIGIETLTNQHILNQIIYICSSKLRKFKKMRMKPAELMSTLMRATELKLKYQDKAPKDVRDEVARLLGNDDEEVVEKKVTMEQRTITKKKKHSKEPIETTAITVKK